MDHFELKYYKYKKKYLNLKNSLDENTLYELENIQQGGGVLGNIKDFFYSDENDLLERKRRRRRSALSLSLHVNMYIHVCIFTCTALSLSLSFFLSLCIYIYIYIYMYLYTRSRRSLTTCVYMRSMKFYSNFLGSARQGEFFYVLSR